MKGQFISSPIGKTTDAKIIRGRENVPVGDNFGWWTCVYVYINRKSKEEYMLEQLQEKYSLGFGQHELWNIIEKEYDAVEDYIMSVNHLRYNGQSDDIVFEE